MRVKAFIEAHIIKEMDNALFFMSNIANTAIPTEFAAWLDVNILHRSPRYAVEKITLNLVSDAQTGGKVAQ